MGIIVVSDFMNLHIVIFTAKNKAFINIRLCPGIATPLVVVN